MRSIGPISRRIKSMACRLMSSEKASPLRFSALRPAARAASVKAIELYHPGVAGRSSSDGRSKKMPSVLAPAPNAAAMREARP